MTDQMELPAHARAVLTGPDMVARTVARREKDPQRRWLLKRPRAVRQHFLEEVIDGGADQERWMLLQNDETRRSYVEEVLEPKRDQQVIWLLRQPRKVRESYIADVIDA